MKSKNLFPTLVFFMIFGVGMLIVYTMHTVLTSFLSLTLYLTGLIHV
jgi:hypothetical protein